MNPTGAIERLFRFRRSAEVEVSTDPEGVLHTEEEIVDGGSYLFSKYAGVHGPKERRFVALLTAGNGKMPCFYVESVGTSNEYINSLASGVLWSIEAH